jgi:hypothetical protein
MLLTALDIFYWTSPLFLGLGEHLSRHLVLRIGLTPFARHPGPARRTPKPLKASPNRLILCTMQRSRTSLNLRDALRWTRP